MTGPKVQGRIGFGLLSLALLALVATARPDDPPKPPPSHQIIEPIAPPLPAEVVGALQEGRITDALDGLNRAADAPKLSPDDRAYLALVRGIALKLDNKGDDARAAWTEALKAGPSGTWAPKLRAELAASQLAAGHADQAEALARAEAEALLDGNRKDRLAGLYQNFANTLLHPESPAATPDPEGAYALLLEARNLAQSANARAKFLLEMARASQATLNHARTLQDFNAYLSEYPQGADRPTARLELGDTQLAAGQSPQARLTWLDLARDLEGQPNADASRIRADALYRIPSTFGISNPPDDNALNLGVAAIRRALAVAPAHPAAVQAAFNLGESYYNRGKAPEALSAFLAFLDGKTFQADGDEPRRRLADLTMTATYRIGQIQFSQTKFDDAINAWRGYLAKFPDGPQSADAQRAILDTQYASAAELFRREQFEAARTAWKAFAAANPLDPRIPESLFLVGEAFAAEQKFPDALAAWELLAAKFPGTEPAAHGRYRIAEIAEQRTGDPIAAVDQFKKVDVEPWASFARQRVAIVESRALTVITPADLPLRRNPPPPDRHPQHRKTNLHRLQAQRRSLLPQEAQRIDGVEALDIGLVAPDAEWTLDVKDFGKYKPIDTTYDLDKKVAIPGAWVVKVTDESHLQATTLVLGSDLDALATISRDQALLFAQDIKTGKGRPNARILIADDSGVFAEGRASDDGVWLHDWDKPRDPNSNLSYLVLDGPNAAGTGLSVSGAVAQGLTPRAYLYTDRPAYRPGQEVQIRGVVREVEAGKYTHKPAAPYRLDVLDSQGRRLTSHAVALSDFGTLHDRLPLDPAAPVGTYSIRLARPGLPDFQGTFEVQAYQVPRVEIRIDLPQAVYYRGETIRGTALATDATGIPLAHRAVLINLPDGRALNGQTDDAGKFPFDFPTTEFSEEQALRVIAQLPEDGVATAARAFVALRAFNINVETPEASTSTANRSL